MRTKEEIKAELCSMNVDKLTEIITHGNILILKAVMAAQYAEAMNQTQADMIEDAGEREMEDEHNLRPVFEAAVDAANESFDKICELIWRLEQLQPGPCTCTACKLEALSEKLARAPKRQG